MVLKTNKTSSLNYGLIGIFQNELKTIYFTIL